VQKIFGDEVYTNNGSVDKKVLARKIFLDENLKTKLEAIIHPLVIQNIQKDFAEYESSAKHPMAFVEAALIYESGIDSKLDYVIVVNASKEICINRVLSRDGVKKEDVIRRMDAQIPPEKKIASADFVIHNDDGIDKLKTKVKFILSILKHLSRRKS
jgi:dephospho-CoA kinase